MCICMHIYAYIYMHMYICIYIHVYIHIYAHIYICICIYMHICICMHMHMYVYAYAYAYAYVCLFHICKDESMHHVFTWLPHESHTSTVSFRSNLIGSLYCQNGFRLAIGFFLKKLLYYAVDVYFDLQMTFAISPVEVTRSLSN